MDMTFPFAHLSSGCNILRQFHGASIDLSTVTKIKPFGNETKY